MDFEKHDYPIPISVRFFKIIKSSLYFSKSQIDSRNLKRIPISHLRVAIVVLQQLVEKFARHFFFPQGIHSCNIGKHLCMVELLLSLLKFVNGFVEGVLLAKES